MEATTGAELDRVTWDLSHLLQGVEGVEGDGGHEAAIGSLLSGPGSSAKSGAS